MTTDHEQSVMREPVYIAKEIAYCMAARPNLTASQIAGDINNPDDELARLARAIDAAGKLVVPAVGLSGMEPSILIGVAEWGAV